MNYNTAKDIAITVGKQLLPFCDRLNIAGSIRRKKPEVKDIELVCLPKRVVTNEVGSLFSNGNDATEVHPEYVSTVASLGHVVKGKPTGKYMQIELHQGINLDLFMPDPWDYFRQYAIRTGSADYAARYIAGGWKAKGWCGSDKGLRLIADCQERISGGKKTWMCINPSAEKPPVWDSEEAFFEWLGVQWIKPELRSI